MAVHASNSAILRGRLRLAVRSPGGVLLAERRATNMVLRGGAGIVARRLAGMGEMPALDAVGVGFALEPGGTQLTALTPPPAEDGIDPAALRTALAPEAFVIDEDQPRIVQLRVIAPFRPSVELTDVTEAGLLAGDTLYNQVLFEPVTLAPGQDVTFFWQIDFPYGS